MYNKDLAKEMLTELYHLRLRRVKRSEWRRRLVKLNMTSWYYSTDDFIQTWEYLEKQNLIRR